MASTYILVYKEPTAVPQYVQKSSTSSTYNLVLFMKNATPFYTLGDALHYALTCVSSKKRKYIYVYDTEKNDSITLEEAERLITATRMAESVPDDLSIEPEELIGDSEPELEPAGPVQNISPETIKINQSELAHMQKTMDLADYDNSVLVEKTKALMNAYLDFAAELCHHNDTEKKLKTVEKEFLDCRHIIEFANVSASSAYHLLALEKKLLLKRRAYKDTHDILEGLSEFQKTTTVENARKVLEVIDNLGTRHYALRTDMFCDILE